jgi:hypothetical protein
MVIPSNGSGRYPLSQTQKYGWRTFVLEFLHGLLTVAWYVVALVEMSMLIGVTRLGEAVAPSSDDLGKDDGRH